MPGRPRVALALTIAAPAAVAAAIALVPPPAAAQRDPMALGREVFTRRASPPCALCHTLAAAEATGAVGPVLDELKPDAARVEKAVRSGLGVMPAFGNSLSDEEIAAVARFVAVSSGGQK